MTIKEMYTYAWQLFFISHLSRFQAQAAYGINNIRMPICVHKRSVYACLKAFTNSKATEIELVLHKPVLREWNTEES